MTPAHLHVAREGSVGLLKFVNPAKLNALTHEMWQGLGDALNDFSSDPSIRAVVISGAERRAFTSGADITQFAEYPQKEFDRVVWHAQAALDKATKPTIAVIHGYCIGGGLDIALRCDIRFAAPGAKFGAPDPKIGTTWGPGTKLLIDAVGAPLARDMILCCRIIDRDEAYRAGLVTRLADSDEIDRLALEEARSIAGFAPLSIRAAKETFYEFVSNFNGPDIKAIYAALKRCTDSEDFVEGQRAFAEHRTPVFKGR
jgi:enoyl-CoA hydratase/carnithine racemase